MNGAGADRVAFALDVYQLMPLRADGRAFRVPPGPRYHPRTVVPGTGSDENERSNPG